MSQPAKRRGDARVVAWLEREKDQCYTSAVVIAQLAYWVRSKEGRQRQALQAWLTRLIDAMHGRVYGFNVSVAHIWAEQEHQLEKVGRRVLLRIATSLQQRAGTVSRLSQEMNRTSVARA
jgi:predicted nucleic acid-binding protein